MAPHRLILAFIPLFLVAGCAAIVPDAQVSSHGASQGPVVSATGPWAAVIEQARRDATSDFERQALSDARISRSEYDEAVNRYVTCVRDAGIQITPIDQHGFWSYEVARNPSDTDDSVQGAMDRCSAGTTAVIASIYIGMVQNPNNEDPDIPLVACFHRKGLAPKSFTVQDWKIATADPKIKPGALPFDESDPRFDECMANSAS